jgi:drug/metabolite transporter (DMT)-like permease
MAWRTHAQVNRLQSLLLLGAMAALLALLGWMFWGAAGVLAHEVSHVRNNDLWVMGMADVFSRMTSLLSLMGQLLLVFSLPLWLVGDVPVPWAAILVLMLAPSVAFAFARPLKKSPLHPAMQRAL